MTIDDVVVAPDGLYSGTVVYREARRTAKTLTVYSPPVGDNCTARPWLKLNAGTP